MRYRTREQLKESQSILDKHKSIYEQKGCPPHRLKRLFAHYAVLLDAMYFVMEQERIKSQQPEQQLD